MYEQPRLQRRHYLSIIIIPAPNTGFDIMLYLDTFSHFSVQFPFLKIVQSILKWYLTTVFCPPRPNATNIFQLLQVTPHQKLLSDLYNDDKCYNCPLSRTAVLRAALGRTQYKFSIVFHQNEWYKVKHFSFYIYL